MTTPGITSPDLRPVPVPDEFNRFYWDAAAEHRLVLQRCDRCTRFQYPPDVVCVHCQSVEMTPTEMSGRGTLYSFAVLDRSFHPGWTTPPSYVVALVDLDEQPGLRMLTNVVDIGPHQLEVGMAMEVTFEERPQITVPQFRARGGPMTSLARPVAMVGVGYSELSRVGVPSPRRLTFDSISAALDDAGLRGADVDGIFEYKFGPESPTAQEAARLIGAPDLAAFADIMASGPSGLASALAGVMAVASGVCETVVVFRTITRDAGYMGGVVGGGEQIADQSQYLMPYGYVAGIIVNMALTKRRWLAQYGRTEEDFGQIAVNARRWAALNPRAVLRDPITMDDYLASRPIADPLRLLDCDYPINGSVATVITTAARAADLRQRPVLVDSMSYGTGKQVDWVFGEDYLYGGTIPCSERMWARSSVTPADVDVAQVYDGFTMVTAQWIEALGFCPIGEFGPWIGDGTRIGPGGDLPINTAGGQLAEGRLHGISFLNEAVLQLRGQCDARQVDGAEVAVVASGLYPQCGAMVLLGG